MKKLTKKLSVNRETLRVITNQELGQAAGGAYAMTTTTRCSTESAGHCNCNTTRGPCSLSL